MFRVEPFYEPHTDSLLFYARNEKNYAKHVGAYFTIFLSATDNSLVGYEINDLDVICKSVEALGAVWAAGPISVSCECGTARLTRQYELLVLMRAALIGQDENVGGVIYDQLHEMSKGVKVSCHKFCRLDLLTEYLNHILEKNEPKGQGSIQWSNLPPEAWDLEQKKANDRGLSSGDPE